VFSNGAMGAMESLKLVGDAAAAVGQPIKDVAFWIGRAYSMIKGGQPFGEAAMRLQEMGIVTPEVRRQMEELQEAGASNIEVWQVLEKRLAEFKGGMEKLSTTGDGLTATLQDNWTAAVRTFGGAFQDVAKNAIKKLSDKLEQLESDGTLTRWAENGINALKKLRDEVTWLYGKLKPLIDALRNTAAVAAGGLAGTWKLIRTGDLQQASDTVYKTQGRFATRGSGAHKRSVDALGYDIKDIIEKETTEAQRKALADQTRRKTEEEKKLGNEKEKIVEDMAKAQKLIDDRRIKEAAEKEAKEREKALAKEMAEREKAALKALEAEHRARVDYIRSEADISAQAEAKARDRLSRAQAAAQQAWRWYRDPESFRAQLEEEKAEAAAQVQFEKDSDRLRRMTNWRSRSLGAEQEAVRRVIFAREEERQAEQALLKIAANTEGLKEMLETLLTSK
jgi:hypothetical protein